VKDGPFKNYRAITWGGGEETASLKLVSSSRERGGRGPKRTGRETSVPLTNTSSLIRSQAQMGKPLSSKVKKKGVK